MFQTSIASPARGDDGNPGDINAPERSDSEHGDGPEPNDDHDSDGSEQADGDAADGESNRDEGQGGLENNLNRFTFLKLDSQPTIFEGFNSCLGSVHACAGEKPESECESVCREGDSAGPSPLSPSPGVSGQT